MGADFYSQPIKMSEEEKKSLLQQIKSASIFQTIVAKIVPIFPTKSVLKGRIRPTSERSDLSEQAKDAKQNLGL